MEPVDPAPSEDYVMVHAVFYATGFGITILLMNLLAPRLPLYDPVYPVLLPPAI